MGWLPSALSPDARLVSVSRRTDVPALFGEWFLARLAAGQASYIPAGPPRRLQCPLGPTDVLAFNFWSKWPAPFLPALEQVLQVGYPVVFNLTLTGLGGTALEPGVPPVERVLPVVQALAARLPPGAVVWRFDPLFTSRLHPAAEERERFCALLDRLAGCVDRVVVSFVTPYGRRVRPDLRRYEAESGDVWALPGLAERAERVGWLAQRAQAAGLPLALCCEPDLGAVLGLPAAGCGDFAWIRRVYPELAALRPPAVRPGRPGCHCSREVDIGVYDTCVLGCRYCYGSGDRATALPRYRSHDPGAPCLIPGG